MPKKPIKSTRDTAIPVRCHECKHASQFIENSCYCEAMGRRTCACMRYGRVCEKYEKKLIYV